MTDAVRSHAAGAGLPLGAIRPRGWLLAQLQLQADGITGQLEDIWPDVGPDSAWRGGDGEAWERGPYYLDGLVALAWSLHDEELIKKAQVWIDAILDSQDVDGYFGPRQDRDWWPRMVACKALTQYADATGDPRVAPFLDRFVRHVGRRLPADPLRGWARTRGADLALTVWWLVDRTGDRTLLPVLDTIAGQTAPWESWLATDVPSGQVRDFDQMTHGVNVAMGLKTGAVSYLVDGDPAHRSALEAAVAELDRWHGLAHGFFSADEFLGGPEATAGVETCLVAELMFTNEIQARTFGGGVYGDRLEALAFNLLPASSDAQMRAHQYHQQANQISATIDRRGWSCSGDEANVFGLEPHFGCCTANLHQAWPKFAAALWNATPDQGLACVAYAPCEVRAELAGVPTILVVDTDYPFDETVTIDVECAVPVLAPLRLRIPQWCTVTETRSPATGSS